MKPSTLQLKAQSLLALDARRKAHHCALSMLHDTLLPTQEEHEARGLKMWRKLRSLEQLAHRGATAYCNGERLNLRPGTSFDFRGDEDAWMQFCECVKGETMKVFGGVLPPGFYVNGDARGMALCIDSERVKIPDGMATNWGGDGILAADISL